MEDHACSALPTISPGSSGHRVWLPGCGLDARWKTPREVDQEDFYNTPPTWLSQSRGHWGECGGSRGFLLFVENKQEVQETAQGVGERWFLVQMAHAP